jgi:S1-C subfamily serine protease
MRVIVEHTAGSRAGQRQEFDDPVVVRFGRHPSNDVQFDAYRDLDASAHHAELRRLGERVLLVDVGSSNGTLLGGSRIGEQALAGGEEVQFGTGGPKVRILLEGVELPRTAAGAPPDVPALGAGTSAAPSPAPAGVRTTVFRAAVASAVQQATRPLRMLVVVLVAVGAVAGIGAAAYFIAVRTPAERRDEERRRKMVDLMEQQRSASAAERAALQHRLDELNAQLKKTGSGGEIARAARGAIYLLAVRMPSGAEDGFCTAFAIEPAVLVTNSHCVAACEKLEGKGGKPFVVRNGHPEHRFPVTAVKKHPGWRSSLQEVTADVALLRVGGTMPEQLELARDDELARLAPGDVIYLYGFPGRLADTRSPEATIVQGVIGRMTRLSGEASPLAEAQLIQHSAFTSGGTSGSPIFDGEGHVIAVNAGGYVENGTLQVLDPTSGRAGELVVARNLAGYNFGMRIDLVRQLKALFK